AESGAPEGRRRGSAADPDGALVLEDGSALGRAAGAPTSYSLLSSRVPPGDDGLFRRVTMRVKKTGVSVHGRKGYWTASPDEALRAANLARINEPRKVVPR